MMRSVPRHDPRDPVSMARPKRQAVQAVSTACCRTVSAVPDEV
jgi:hypothetical protein